LGEISLKVKKRTAQVTEEIKQNLNVEENYVELEKLTVAISLKKMTLEEKIQEASKPLFLKRYE